MSDSILVQKYGGTSVETVGRIQKVARQVAHRWKKDSKLIVVVSAMGETTNTLIQLAHQVHPVPPEREMDMLLTTGERVSMALLAMALERLGIPAVSLTGSQSGILTDGAHRNARILSILGNRIEEQLCARRVVIVAGFQGVSREKEITTLGRGGSDTTAVGLAARFGAKCCELYSDVDGVLTGPPKWIPNARTLPVLSYEGALAFARWGAQLLHPRAVAVAQKWKVPLWLFNSFRFVGDRVKTKVMTVLEGFQIQGVSVLEDLVFGEGVLRGDRIDWDLLKQLGFQNVSFERKPQGIWMRFGVLKETLMEKKAFLEKEKIFSHFSFQEQEAVVALLGCGFAENALDLMKEVSQVLKAQGVFVRQCWVEPHALLCFVPLNEIAKALRGLHRHFLEQKKKSKKTKRTQKKPLENFQSAYF